MSSMIAMKSVHAAKNSLVAESPSVEVLLASSGSGFGVLIVGSKCVPSSPGSSVSRPVGFGVS